MVVPAVGVVVGNDDGSTGPEGLGFQCVDHVHNECLLVQRIRVSGMGILVSRRLQEADCGKITRCECIVKVVNVVLMISRIPLLSDCSGARRAGVECRVNE